YGWMKGGEDGHSRGDYRMGKRSNVRRARAASGVDVGPRRDRQRICHTRPSAGSNGVMESNPFDPGDGADAKERALVAPAKQGDREGQGGCAGPHRREIYNTAIGMPAQPADAEDATQEILVKAITRLAAFEGRSTVRTWLYRIVVNHVLNMRRGRAERPMTFS